MRVAADTPEQYMAQLPDDRKKAITELRAVIRKNLPKGFKETISSGMLAYVVPHSKYPDGYHCDPEQPLPFMYVASQKNFIALYHMALYADPKLLNWFTTEYPKHSARKLDMGKSCIRFKKPEEIPMKFIGELVSKVSPDDWIALYEKNLKR